VRPLWIFLTGLVVGLGSILALQARNRETASASAKVGLAAFTLASGLARPRPDALRADFAGAAISGLLQLAVVVGFLVALVFGTYWLFGN
jgi:hypothetical protein